MKKIYLIDWNSFIYRMFFALPEFSTKEWKIVNATFGMAKFFVEQLKRENPDYLIFIKDAKWDNFRHKLYAQYKATRERMPDNLRVQISDIEKMINLMWIDIVEVDWYEADDVIWTFAHKFDSDQDLEVDILTWDKDLFSLVSSNIKIYDTMKKKKFWPEETREKFWVDSDKIIDYLSIVWDKADNIPGIDWFGPQKAIALINTIWWVEDIYKTVDKFESWELDINTMDKSIQSCFKWKTYDKLRDSRENAFLSKKLATLDKKVALELFDLEKFKFDEKNILNNEVLEFFRQLEFFSLVWWEDFKELKKWEDLDLRVNIVWDKIWLDSLFEKIKKSSEISFDTETTSLDVFEAEIVWISIYIDDKNIYYINRLHSWPQLSDEDLRDFLSDLFDLDITIIWHNLKYDLEIVELFLQENSKNHIWSDNHQMSLSV